MSCKVLINDNTGGESTNEPSPNTGRTEESSLIKPMFCGNEVLLSTTFVQIRNGNGQLATCRSLDHSPV